jgi:hypothetical protein
MDTTIIDRLGLSAGSALQARNDNELTPKR